MFGAICKAKISKEYIKVEIDNFDEFEKVNLDEMFDSLWVCVDHRVLRIIISLDNPRENKTPFRFVID